MSFLTDPTGSQAKPGHGGSLPAANVAQEAGSRPLVNGRHIQLLGNGVARIIRLTLPFRHCDWFDVNYVPPSHVSMVCSLLATSGLVMLGRFPVMACGMCKML
jgi:hypothetical protein